MNRPKKPRTRSIGLRLHLTRHEIDAVIKAAGRVGRHRHRDATMILVAFRHGLRVSELVGLRWDQVDFADGSLHVSRKKKGNPMTHPLTGDELRALRRLRRESPACPYVFVTERRGPMEVTCFRKIVKRAGELAGLDLHVYPHMFRHACGYALADKGLDTRLIQDYLGHKNIRHTVDYTKLSGRRFRGLWDD